MAAGLYVVVFVTSVCLGFAVHWGVGVATFVGGFVGCVVLQSALDRKRIAALTPRFGVAIAEKIVNGEIWQGATREMIVESLGRPAHIDEKVMKDKVRHTLKYEQRGRNKYALRVTLENGVCVGWDDKR